MPLGSDGGIKWIANYDNQFKGPIPMRQALAESRNAVAVWITREIGVNKVIRTAHQMGIRTPLQPYSARRSVHRRCGCWSWRTPIAPSPRASWRNRTSSTA